MWRLEVFNGRPGLYYSFVAGVVALGLALEGFGPSSLDKVGPLGAVAVIGTTSLIVANSARPLRSVEPTNEVLE